MVKTNLKLVAQKYKVAFEFPYQINSRWRSLKHSAVKNMANILSNVAINLETSLDAADQDAEERIDDEEMNTTSFFGRHSYDA